MIPTEWLRERLDTTDAAELARRDLARLGVDQADWDHFLARGPFAQWRRRWSEFLASMRPGDELWRYETSHESTAHLAGAAGYAIVREGKPIASLNAWRT
jgi:hypothetical protein